MPTASTFPLYDRILKGTLTGLLEEWRAEGVTYDEIAERLRGRGVQTTRSTVQRWCAERGITS